MPAALAPTVLPLGCAPAVAAPVLDLTVRERAELLTRDVASLIPGTLAPLEAAPEQHK